MYILQYLDDSPFFDKSWRDYGYETTYLSEAKEKLMSVRLLFPGRKFRLASIVVGE